ncbi:MAG: HlyD family secretion protein [Acidobacteriota bacterium]
MVAGLKKWIALGVLMVFVLAGGGVGWERWRHAQIHVSTDNAYVQGAVFYVASRIPGTLLTVSVTNNQPVNKGDPIATIDPRDYDVAIARAEAALAEMESALATDRAMIAQYEAQVKAAQSQLDLARIEKERIGALYERQSIAKQKLDQVATQLDVAAAQVVANEKAVSAARARLVVSRAKADAARATLETARLQRSYCTISSPVTGLISRKSAEVGQVVSPGQPLCAVVPLDLKELWVEANFKETQLKNVRPGQRVTIRADIDPDRVCTGVVESIAAGTGAAFSLLPPENAAGNWVKVVQRVPVRIRVDPAGDPQHRLRLGLSVTVEIDTTSG